MNITPHFTWQEFACHDGTQIPEDLKPNTIRLCEQLEILRAVISEQVGHDSSLSVMSGYRTVEYNKKIYEARGQKPTDSQHSRAAAADIVSRDLTPGEVHALIEKLIAAGKMEQGGLGWYKTFIHYDVRGSKARWDQR